MSLDAGAAWAAWTTALRVVSAPAPDAHYLRATIPFSIAPDADGDYPDLRVIDAHDNEVPYVIDPQRAAPPPQTLTPTDTGFVPHRWTQAVFDLGPEGSLVDTIRLSVDETRRETYLDNVALDASDDRTTWRVVRDDALIYHVDGHGCTTITFPPSRSRWLRVRILDARSPFPIDGAVAERGELAIPEPRLAPVPVDSLRADATGANATPHRQTWIATSATPIRPSAVAFSGGGSATFERHVTVESSDDGVAWDAVATDVIARWPDGGERTSFVFTERTARRWRITVDNFNDRPVAGLRPRLLAQAHTLVFPALYDAPYRVLSGNPSASAPVYDLRDQLEHARWSAAAATIETTPLTVPAQPVALRGSATVLTAVLAAIGIVLAAAAVWTLRSGEAST